MEVRSDDLLLETYNPYPPGGQHVGVSYGIKVTHIPTGLIAISTAGRSQHRNKEIAIDMIAGGLTNPHLNYKED